MFATEAWVPPLQALCDRLRRAARAAIADALANGTLASLGRPVREGVGDTTFGLDECTERELDLWFEESARRGPLSVLTEDRGWRHRGPDGRGGWRELPGFDHGGPRIAIDPVDGTRNVMADLRSAWVVVSFAPPGRGAPRMRDLTLGVVSEIPDSRAARYRELVGIAGGACTAREVELDASVDRGGQAGEPLASATATDSRRALEQDGRAFTSGRVVAERVLSADALAHKDHGYFTFFRFLPDQRPLIARVEAAFFARLAEHEGADVRTCWDDQYISSGGQLALIALGVYRMATDLRAWVATKRGVPTMTTKPYDLAGAVVCARAAGAIVTTPDGAELDFPIDCETPVDFAAFANRATFERVLPHLRAALRTLDA
ncbi:MAG: hypothetical protein IT453_19005 [Planctomycetes bacterium]|nr:hypothetical protein [Planctomycetota bacterium]